MKIEQVPIEKLIKDPANARKHNQKNIEAIKGSLLKFGQQKPIVVNDKNIVIAGNGTLEAARLLGWKDISVVITNLKGSELAAFGIADNRTAELAEWDDAALADILKSLKDEDFDLSEIGFEEADLDKILNIESEGKTDPDEIPETPEEPKSNTGEVYQCGRHRVLCGDSTDKILMSEFVNYATMDTILFDPPFQKLELYDGMPTQKEFENSNIIVFYDFMRFGKAINSAIVNGWAPMYEMIWDCVTSWYSPNRPLARHKAAAIFGKELKWNFDSAIVHDGKKRKPQKGSNTRGAYDITPLEGAVHMRTVEPFSNTALNDEHGHGKPIEWIAGMLRGLDSKKIFDPFMGSGTTLIVAEKINADCWGVEIMPEYVDVIRKRWAEFVHGKNCDWEKLTPRTNSKN